ncbi:unnamed protein product [Callosobruchus maculatus]|uniref:Uncharacterized protein n=1 Tax=Callosobruchus maculatus TaxID=64391 RepID=A0A653CA33_CALMS|nr:unnamed protein product [Callosobruchus maculatus]
MSATAELNSLKCSSGQNIKGYTRSPDVLPALNAVSSQSPSFVCTAACVGCSNGRPRDQPAVLRGSWRTLH